MYKLSFLMLTVMVLGTVPDLLTERNTSSLFSQEQYKMTQPDNKGLTYGELAAYAMISLEVDRQMVNPTNNKVGLQFAITQKMADSAHMSVDRYIAINRWVRNSNLQQSIINPVIRELETEFL